MTYTLVNSKMELVLRPGLTRETVLPLVSRELTFMFKYLDNSIMQFQ
jgi:hypothetical protein